MQDARRQIRIHQGLRFLIVLIAAVALGAPVAAHATHTQSHIDGQPLDVYADEGAAQDSGQISRLQARFDGSTDGEFFPPANDAANAGFHLAVFHSEGYDLFGPVAGGLPYTLVSGPTLGGTGTSIDPYRIETVYDALPAVPSNGPLRVTQVIAYVNGERNVIASYTVTNQDPSSPVNFRASIGADLYIAGSDSGTGYFDPGPPREVGGVNQETGAAGVIREVAVTSPWSAHQADHYGTVFSLIADPSGPGFTNLVTPDYTDNGVGVQWDDYRTSGLAPSASGTFQVLWRFARFNALQLDPQVANLLVGSFHTVVATAEDTEGAPAPGQLLRYEISGANPSTGTVTTGPDGRGAISWQGLAPGTDVLAVYTDLNGNAAREANEPLRTASVNWFAAEPPGTPEPGTPEPGTPGTPAQTVPPPVLGEAVVVKPASGEVFVSVPPGTVLARAVRSQGGKTVPGIKGRTFVPLRRVRQLPVGTLVDTRTGSVRLSSARVSAGKTQTADFVGGVFQVLQSRSTRLKGLTTVTLKGTSFKKRCGRRRRRVRRSDVTPLADAAKRRRLSRRSVRRLRGRGRGRFRTRGRHSSATVRGTTWSVTDRCDGTLTKVSRGKVVVRDFRRKKNIRLGRGKSYLARAG